MSWLVDSWYREHRPWLPLRLAAVGFTLAALARRRAYARGWRRGCRPPVPVIVVGNVTVGGTGKTPLVAWLHRRLTASGWRVGVIARGYGGRSRQWPQRVTAGSDPEVVGDEPVLLARQGVVPIAVGPDRCAAANLLSGEVDVIVSDDGLQHYRLARDVEVAVMDGKRRLGNGWCLPAGPLREPPARLAEVDEVVVNGEARAGETGMQLTAHEAVSVCGDERMPLSRFAGQRVHAVAGIGHPQRFFRMLEDQGIEVTPHPFPDHHRFRPRDIDCGEAPVLMTDKDAIKCAAFAGDNHWRVPVEATLSEDVAARLLRCLGLAAPARAAAS